MARPLDAEVLPAQAPATGATLAAGTARRWWRRFARNRGAVFGLAVFLAVVLSVLFYAVKAIRAARVQPIRTDRETAYIALRTQEANP